MGVVGWIIVGLLAGGLARMATGSEKRGCLATMVIGILGGVIGGALFNAAGGKGIGDGGLGSIFVAFIGACALLFIMQAVGVVQKRR
ncbi:MAG TPA: GlsB/YeaQ/YmgE family stress response membrane protein [Acidimicrobiales bacterium]|jgi:uncharacterized membrane protein YeaQ/YmgE (transglycosylase-associated protein family)|nr:GlsB/YeaQ/YmgE family stress response membrane protein [Acidimicrobiales bacterium]